MSLLADMLSKVSHKKIEGSVPPGLARSVVKMQNKTFHRRRLILACALGAFLISAGVGALYYIGTFTSSSLLTPEAKARMENLKEPSSSSSSASNLSINQLKSPALQAQPPQTAQMIPNKRPIEKDISKVTSPKNEVANVPSKSTKTLAISSDKLEKNEGLTANPGREMAQKHKTAKDELLYEAQNLEAAKDYDGALRTYKKALDMDRQNYLILNNMAGIMISKGSFKEAEEYARASLKVNETYVPSLINLSIALIRLGNGEEGKTTLLKAVSIEPTDPQSLVNLALLLEKQNNTNEATRYFSMLADLKDGRGFLGLARLAENSGKVDEAKRTYRQIIAIDGIENSTKRFATERLSILEGR